ncbi:MAG: radical SAM protein [Acidobacteriota bacterium]|nr:radical SAM protein [Acidobacteriota bacterium]
MIDRLPILILHPHSACNCRCAMCEIWKRTAISEIGAEQFNRMLPDFERLGVEWVVFSGGEPLLDRDLFRKAGELRQRGIRTTLLSSGLLLEKYAPEIVREFGDVIVSLDGPPEVHDAIRGVRRGFELLQQGVGAIHHIRPGFPVSGRCTVQRLNCAHLVRTAETARGFGLKSISFLAADLHSEAFNRQDGRENAALRAEDLAILDAEIGRLERFGGFVAESPEKLRRIAGHFRAHLGLSPPLPPKCNAPWVSAVVEADGAVRPCFFHRPIGRLNGAGLTEVLNGPAGVEFRKSLRVEEDPTCRQCVCTLFRKTAGNPEKSSGGAR